MPGTKKEGGEKRDLDRHQIHDRVTIFFGSDVLRLATEDYMLFGWNSCARCLTRTLGSIELFLTEVNTVWFEPHQKIKFCMGLKLYRVTIFFGSHVLRLATEDYCCSDRPLARCLTRTLGSIEFFLTPVNTV